jgi:uncharacterized protein
MLEPLTLEGPPDLAALDDLLASDRGPPECLQLSELDCFLAGIVAGPELIPPSTWQPMIWRNGETAFADLREANTIRGTITRHCNEIVDLVDYSPGAYRPVLLQREDGTLDASD